MRRKHAVQGISLLLILSGCVKEPAVQTESTQEKAVSVLGNAETVSVDVTHSERKYSDSMMIYPGHWEKKDEQFLGPVFTKDAENTASNTEEGMVFPCTSKNGTPYEYKVSCGSLLDLYLAGEECSPRFSITRIGKKDDEPRHIYGSMYFADIQEAGEDPFGQTVTVRAYFERKNGAADPRVFMHHFGTGEDEGRYGSDENKEYQEYFFYPEADFPRMVKEGDTISLVLDITEEDSGISMRRIWNYAWVKDEKALKPAGAEEEDHSDSGWLCTTYPGTWELKDIRYVSEEHDKEGDSGVRVIAERKGVDGQDVRYVFEKESETLRITIPELKFLKRYYPLDSFYEEVEIFADSESEMVAVNCSLSIGEVRLDEESGKLRVMPESYFTVGWKKEEIEVFGPIPHDETMSWRNDLLRGYLVMNGCFPEGKETGDTICIVYGMMDRETRAFRMFNIYEYEWKKGPVDVWSYNEPMY